MFPDLPDTALTLLDNINLFWFIAAAAGGFLGAAIGANVSFGFTGVLILVGFAVAVATGSDIGFTYLAFGPVFGPHITFAGGVAAAAYAAKKGHLQDTGKGRDLNTALAGLGEPDILLVGACFGMSGYVIERLVEHIPWFGSHTDAVAFTVIIQALIARALFSKAPLFKWTKELTGDKHWLVWQEKPSQWITIGSLGGLFGAGVSLAFTSHVFGGNLPAGTEDILLANAKTLPFAISALTIFLIARDVTIPVTHHITIIGGLAAMTFYPLVVEHVSAGGAGVICLLLGALFGIMAAGFAEIGNRLCYSPGDTHIDPPAFSIWPSTTVVMGLGVLLGA